MPSSLVRERQPQVWRVRKMGAPEPVLSLPKDLAFETCETKRLVRNQQCGCFHFMPLQLLSPIHFVEPHLPIITFPWRTLVDRKGFTRAVL
jgi:hypothetical protein